MSKTVIGIFDNAAEAKKAVDELKSIGFGVDKVDVSNSTQGTGTTGTTTTKDYDDDDNDSVGSFFRSLFNDDDDDARAYSAVARRSSATVTVHAKTDEEARQAAEVMDRYGSVDVGQRASEYGISRGAARTGNTQTSSDGKSIPIIEENLEVGKREVETGGARLRSRIVERPVEEHLRLRTEHVRVERNAVNRPASEADFNNFKEGEIEITERAEVPVVNKSARVVEEVSLDKEVEERDETVRGTVRSTEVDVDRMDDKTNRPGQNPNDRPNNR